VTTRTLQQRALGAVVGSAVGDALGAPFEFGPAGAYTERFPERVVGGIGEMVGGGRFRWAPGEFTDDTQMAVVQAESLLACRDVDTADLFERFQVWASGAPDIGVQTRRVLSSGLPVDEAAAHYFARHPDNAAGNGSLMRATPAAVHFANRSVEETVAAAHTLSAVTHADPCVGHGVALYHRMIRAALAGDDPFAELAAALTDLPTDQSRWVKMLAPHWTPSDTRLPNGTVWTCLAQAVWAVRATTTFEDAIVAAIDLGKDTDTVAAVTGGLAGAIHGIQAIPSRWTTYVHGHVSTHDGRKTYRDADLQLLTLALLGIAAAPADETDSPVGPGEIVAGIHAANLFASDSVPLDWAVISLCRTGDRFAEHPYRRTIYLVDQANDHNHGLALAVADAVDTIDAFVAERRPVVVHCFGGASRTGLVLRAWLMRTNGWDERTATEHLAERWEHLGLWNADFTDFLRGEWTATSRPSPMPRLL
jgi:ADP-ribosyl-[dinitrogen reductase] hydrolase